MAHLRPFLTLIQRRSMQTWAARAAFAVTFVDQADGCATEVPSLLAVPRANPSTSVAEGLSLRCRSAQCPCRAGAAPAVDDDPAATMTSENAADDRAHSELAHMHQDVGEAEVEGVTPMSMPLSVLRKICAISPPSSTSCTLPGRRTNT